MKSIHQILLIIIALLTITTVINNNCDAIKLNYHNYRVYRLKIENAEQFNGIANLEEEQTGYDFWQSPKSTFGYAELMVAPQKFNQFLALMNDLNIEHTLKVENVQSLIDKEQSAGHTRAIGWTKYNTLDEIYSWLDELIAGNPSVLTPFTIGYSHEQRPIRGVKLSHKAGNPGIFIESNIHAREWITSATATWFLNELLKSTDPEIVSMSRNIDWYIIPVFNVDGFVYAHEVDRMWRKTRQNHATVCFGTDANRNLGYQWNTVGASSDPCSNNFAGPFAFSEPETRALADFVATVADKINIYLSFHSYGQYLLFPWGHSTTELTATHDLQDRVANLTVTAIAERYGTVYTPGTSSAALYLTSGTTVDYFYSQYDIPIGYTFEMRDHPDGIYGFVLPADQILPNCEEIMDGMKALVAAARAENVLVNN